jgi:hypothetical protein
LRVSALHFARQRPAFVERSDTPYGATGAMPEGPSLEAFCLLAADYIFHKEAAAKRQKAAPGMERLRNQLR